MKCSAAAFHLAWAVARTPRRRKLQPISLDKKALCLASVPPRICECSWLAGHRNDASTAFRSVPCRTSIFHGLQTGLSM